jgi:hypothetical protein
MMKNISVIPAIVLFIIIGVLLFDNGEVRGSQRTIYGRVVDPYMRGIEDAMVRVRGATEFVTTGSNGSFSITMDPDRYFFRRIVITAGKEGWFNNGTVVYPDTNDVTIMLNPVPVIDNKYYSFIISSPSRAYLYPFSGRMGMMGSMRNCGSCHRTHLWEWGPSRMGKSAENMKVLDMYDRFIAERRPEQKNTCADCHAPQAAINAPGKTDLRRAVSGGMNRSKGIECDFCHKISDVIVSNSPGVQSIIMNRLEVRRGMMGPIMVYGPYDDTVAMPMLASYNSLYSRSEYCSSCHQDGLELPDGKRWDYESVYPGASRYPLYRGGRIIPNQWTYQEWLEWQTSISDDDPDKGRQCQDCHMNWTKDMVPYYRYVVDGMARRMMGVRRTPESIYPHKFEGATRKRLEGSVRLGVDAERDGTEIKVRVDVTNVNAGHRLPTGETTRNMILLVTARDEDGRILDLISGSRVPVWGGEGSEEGDYAGDPGKGFARITVDEKGNINVPVWKAVGILSDNRIRPGETDSSFYRFRLPSDNPEQDITVTAKLIYRTEFRDLGEEMKWTTEDILMKERTVDID